VRVEELTISRPMRCITVAAPDGLFVVKEYVVTHNSAVLLNISRALMQMGHSVLFYTLEMYELDVLRRMVASISRRPTNQLEDHLHSIQEVMEELEVYTSANILVREYPGYKLTLEQLDAHLLMAEAAYGKIVPVIDYMALLRHTGGSGELWRDLPELAVGLRNIARKHRVPIITAHQASLDGFSTKKLGAEHQAGAKQIGAVVEYMWSIDQDGDDYAANRFTMTPFLNRHERKDRITYWQADYTCSRIQEISEETYTLLAQKDPDHQDDLPPRRRRGGRA